MPEPSEEVPFESEGGGRVAVSVSGEFCLDNSHELRRTLHDALARTAEGVDLDLGGMTFADCSALNVLLAARAQAVAAGKTITVTVVSPAVERLLTLTDSYALFSAAPDGPGASGGSGQPAADDGRLRTGVVHIRRATRTRPDIDLARGVLMATFGLSRDAAREVLVTTSRKTGTPLHDLARDVLTTVHGASLPDPVRRQLTAVVATARRTDGRPHGATRAERAARPACA
ncbi:STAS domain-containing protein [Streptomyces sp. Ag109_O5-10]|uniref:STAS domain-containing protein n=1 Tax=Streptomyces sp. Ag109_O5-10 TaxID=1855349 RepID=UPI0008970B5C|nr:STAS domain-containing protein [Streptomyces sp. Ag109_O5-10]SEE24539.1 anti-anti-sigma factor [Streptomyces sp. Ag109_O5-10]